MDTQERGKLQQFTPERGRPDMRTKTAAEAVAESLMTPIFAAPTVPQVDAIAAPRTRSWFSIATVLTIIALAACAAAAVAATYGPVFTQPMMAP